MNGRFIRSTFPLFAAFLLVGSAVAAGYTESGDLAAFDDRKGKGEISIGVGAFPVPVLFELTTDIAMAGLSLGTLDPTTESKGTPLFLEYSRFLTEKTRLTGNFNYASFDKEYEVAGTGVTAGTVEDDFYSFLVGVNYHYLSTRAFDLYIGILGGGAILRSSTTIDELEVTSEFLPAYQLNALGIRLGGRTAADLSLGVGYKGLLNLGLVHRF